MINWFNIPDEGLSNGGLFEVKELEVTENGTYETKGEMYNKVNVNVEGGGGESDFSTATAKVTTNGATAYIPFISDSEQGHGMVGFGISENGEYTIALFKGASYVLIEGKTVSVSGDIQSIGGKMYQITGDCTITIS